MTDFDLKISQHRRKGGAAEVSTMPGCFHCQQVCYYQLLLVNPPAETQHSDATVVRNVCRVAQWIPFFILFVSLKKAFGFWIHFFKKKKAAALHHGGTMVYPHK